MVGLREVGCFKKQARTGIGGCCERNMKKISSWVFAIVALLMMYA